MTRAVIWLAGNDQNRWLAAAARYVERRGYELVGVVRDDGTGGTIEQAEGMVRAGEAELVVCARRDQVPPRTVETVDEEGTVPGVAVPPAQRRPARAEPVAGTQARRGRGGRS